MEKCTEEESMEFASSQNFTDALIGIVDDFNKRIVPTQSSHNQSSFSSHYCYELALFMLLGLLDKSSLLIAFVKTATVNRINECLQAICSTILHDHLYLTQVRLPAICLHFRKITSQQCIAGGRPGDHLSRLPLLPAKRALGLKRGHRRHFSNVPLCCG
jgi:hypothetical protein